jgi:hypothetical protein
LAGNRQGQYQSEVGHFPPSQIFLLETLPKLLQEKAQSAGPQTSALVKRLFELGNHPLRYLRRVQGILGLLKEVTGKELESAVQTARMLGEELPRPSVLREIVRQARTAGEEPAPVERKPNRYVRSTRKIPPTEPSEGTGTEERRAAG